MKSEVVTVSSFDPRQPYYRFCSFKESVRRFGVEPTVLGYNDSWHGLFTKPRRYREFLRKGASGDILVVTDAWDIAFAASPTEVMTKYLELWPSMPIVFNAERNCFPCSPETKEGFDKIADAANVTTPWRYLNSGFMVGRPADILALLESMKIDDVKDDHQLPDGTWVNPNDQEHFQWAFLKQPVPMVLDYNTELCIAAHGSSLDEFDFSGDRIVNKITGTTPLVAHFNGDAKNNLAPTFLKHLGLPER